MTYKWQIIKCPGEASACDSDCPPALRPRPRPTPSTGSSLFPRDALKLRVSTNVLGLVKAKVGAVAPYEPCCSLLDGLVDLNAVVCPPAQLIR
uniref:Hydrophobic seed protein domain-containing protein n=1 Tax=Oryza barthii TaxID=65489 RepID=A0A0D3GTF2_9ORYZ